MAADTVRIVIAGAGIAGVPLAYAVKARLHGRAEVTVVSESPDFHFVPANPWLALGLRAESDVSFAIEPLLSARKIALRVAPLERIDLQRARMRLEGGAELPYDYLAIATGIRPDWTLIPGTLDNPAVHSVIRPADAVAAHDAYQRFLEHPGPVVIAAAPAVPTIGPMYEYAFLLDADLRRRALRQRVPITLITPEPYPGHVGLDKPLAKDQLTEALRKQAIAWIGNAAVQRCEDRRLHFTVQDLPHEPVPRSEDFEYAVIWPPFRGIDAVAGCASLCDAQGLIAVDEYQRARGHANVFAIGACTAKPLLTRTPVPVGSPDAVYVIQQQVAVLAENLTHSVRGEPLMRADIEREHWIVDMGKRGAAYLAAPQMPLRDIQWLHQGRWVYEAKREFEDYFIHQILFGAGPHGQIPALVWRLRSRAGSAPSAERVAALGPHLTLSTDMRRTIEALARELNVDARAFSQQLLERSLAETLSCLDGPARERVRAEVHSKLVDELETHQERVRFEGGAP